MIRFNHTRAMAATSTHLCNKIIQKQVVGALLCTIANKHYVDSQKYAANTLIVSGTCVWMTKAQ